MDVAVAHCVFILLLHTITPLHTTTPICAELTVKLLAVRIPKLSEGKGKRPKALHPQRWRGTDETKNVQGGASQALGHELLPEW